MSVEIANFEKLISSIVTYGIAIIFNFLLLKYWVFKSYENSKKKFIKYNIIGCIGYLLNSLGFYLLTIKFEFNYLVSQFCLFFLIALFNYTLNTVWTFKNED